MYSSNLQLYVVVKKRLYLSVFLGVGRGKCRRRIDSSLLMRDFSWDSISFKF